jgi:hypothetical protein
MTTKADTFEKPAKWALSPAQESAAQLLATGSSLTAAAEAVSVSRQTVSEWYNTHLGFQAALMRYRRELWATQTDRLRALGDQALNVLEAALDPESNADWPDRLRAASMILKAMEPEPEAKDLADLEVDAAQRASDRNLRSLLTTWQPTS